MNGYEAGWFFRKFGQNRFMRKKMIFFMCVFVLAVMLTECLYFHHVLSRDESLVKSDVVVVFSGRGKRIQKGYALAGSGYADNLLISRETRKRLNLYERKYALPEKVRSITEDKARTTFENAFYAGRIISKNQFKSIILVTSIDHLPRSYFCLRCILLGAGVKIQTCGVERPPVKGRGWFKSSKGLKMIYNEMVEFWGSLAELAIYKLNGALPGNHPSDTRIVQHLKALLLFDVP